jgi:amino acid transporter
MWANRWVRVGAIAVGFFLINGLARWISFLTKPPEDPLAVQPVQSTGQTVIAVVGELLIVGLLAVVAAYWAPRHPPGRVYADLGLATLGGTVLAMFIAPFMGGNKPFDDGLETFVIDFGQFLGLGALGIVIGFTVMVVLGKDWKSRGLGAYAERYGRNPRTAPAGTRKR